MKNQYPIAVVISTYALAWSIIIHWLFICSFDEFLHLYKKGFSLSTIQSLPVYLKPIYNELRT